MKTRILVADDERDIVDLIKYNLDKEGYEVLVARNGKDALVQAKKQPHLILLDVMMPELDGWEVVRTLKRDPQTASIPIVFLTARGGEVDEVVGLELGADDYIQKPVSIPKLIARVKNVLRRKEHPAPAAGGETIRHGAIEIHPDQFRVMVDKKEIFFPKKEFELLLHLVRHAGRVFSRDALLAAVWGADVYVVDRTVDVHIRKIREKLAGHADYIDTIKGVGYRMKEM